MIYFKARLKYKTSFNKVKVHRDQVPVCINLLIKKIFILRIEKAYTQI